MEISVMDILAARDRRAATQKRLLEQYGKPLICFTMNIAGPVKYSRWIEQGYQLGKRLLNARITALHFEESISPTGCEGFFVADLPAEELKRICVMIEDSQPVCRLFDMDVLDTDGRKLSREALGLEGRKCLICHKPAYECSRSRVHSVQQLQDKTNALLETATEQAYIASCAYQALLQEVCTTPKPGLVDLMNSGSHKDMDIHTFIKSANALRSYFYEAAGIGAEGLSPADTFAKLRAAGIRAEKAMFAATGGVNTHKGAIFTLGLLCAAACREDIFGFCAAMTKDLTQRDFSGITEETAVTAGEKLYALYGITGIRGQAERGFPAVKDVGLPVLKKGLENGLSLNDAGCATLLHILCAVEDTNMITRSDLTFTWAVCGKILAWLRADPYPTRQALESLDEQFIFHNLSPGGSADLLAATYFLHFLR